MLFPGSLLTAPSIGEHHRDLHICVNTCPCPPQSTHTTSPCPPRFTHTTSPCPPQLTHTTCPCPLQPTHGASDLLCIFYEIQPPLSQTLENRKRDTDPQMHPHSTPGEERVQDILGAPHLRTREGFEREMKPQG